MPPMSVRPRKSDADGAARRRATSLSVVLLALASCAGGREAALQSAAERFEARLDSLRIAAKIPGLSVAVLADTTVLLARGYGFADVENEIPATAETPYHIASVTKTISAVTALRLAERGAIDLDRPMSASAEW